MSYNIYSRGKKQNPLTSRTANAYIPQYHAAEWPCWRCGKVEVPEKKRKKGEPRLKFKFEFNTALERDFHTAKEHS